MVLRADVKVAIRKHECKGVIKEMNDSGNQKRLRRFLINFIGLDSLGQVAILIMLDVPVKLDNNGKALNNDQVIKDMRDAFLKLTLKRQMKILEIMEEAIKDEPSAESDKENEQSAEGM